MYYGFDFLKIDNNSVKQYTFVFSSLAQFAAQLRCAVINDFIYKSRCLVNDIVVGVCWVSAGPIPTLVEGAC